MLENLIIGSFPINLGVQVVSNGKLTFFKVCAIIQGKSFNKIKGTSLFSNSILYLPMNEVSPPFVGKVGKVKDRIKNTEENFVLKLSKCYSENKNMDRMDNFSTDFVYIAKYPNT